MPGHNASLAILGVFILWFGWYGFNPGSALAIINYSSVAALAAVNTTLSAAAGTLATMFTLMIIELLSTGHIVWDLIGAANGTLAGLVGITASCAFVEVRKAKLLWPCKSRPCLFGIATSSMTNVRDVCSHGPRSSSARRRVSSTRAPRTSCSTS